MSRLHNARKRLRDLLGPLLALVLSLAIALSGAAPAAAGDGMVNFGVRVLQASSRPPGYVRSFLRAALGALGIAAAGLGQLPMMFDPARRALHDRLFGTRVVKH